MRIAQLSDFHFTHLTWNPLRLLSKRFFGHFNWIFRRDREFSSELLEPLPLLFTDLKVDLILLGGDFTTTALKEEFDKAKTWVKKLEQPWLAIPGNHDHYTFRSFRTKAFYDYFSNPPSGFFSLKQKRIEAHPIAPHWWIVALDTARPTHPASSEGIFPLSLEKDLKEILTQIPSKAKILLFNHYPFFRHDAPHRGLERGEALEAILRSDPRICLYLHGHTHRHIFADLQEDNLPILLDSGSSSQGPRGTWNLIDLDETGCTATLYRWNRGWYQGKQERFSWKRSPPSVSYCLLSSF